MNSELRKNNKIFIISLIIFFILIILVSISIIIYTLYISDKNNLNSNINNQEIVNKDIDNNENNKVEKKEIKKDNDILIQQEQTSYYSEDTKEYNKFIIKDEEDLKAFRLIHPLSPEIKDEFLKDRTIFILVITETSGSIKYTFLNASIKNNKIHFNIIKETPEVGTMDMATWYFISSIPNEILEGLDLNEWLDPKEVQNKLNINANDII